MPPCARAGRDILTTDSSSLKLAALAEWAMAASGGPPVPEGEEGGEGDDPLLDLVMEDVLGMGVEPVQSLEEVGTGEHSLRT